MIFLALRIILFLSATILLSAQETTTAVTLGPSINTAVSEIGPVISPDGHPPGTPVRY